MTLNLKWNGGELLFGLGAILVACKLLSVITWSWWVVLTPFWISLALTVGLGIAFVLFNLLVVVAFFAVVVIENVRWKRANRR